MTDLDRFKEFFDAMGVRWHYDGERGMPIGSKGMPLRHGAEPDNCTQTLGVSQAIFCFDKDDRYIGTVDDDMGFFTGRKP